MMDATPRQHGSSAAVLLALALLGACQPALPGARPGPAAVPPRLAAPQQATPRAWADRPDLVLTGEVRQGAMLRGSVPGGTTALQLDGKPVAFAPDGQFIIAFDRDAPLQAVLEAVREDGRRFTRKLAVGAGNWAVEQVDAPLLGSARSSEEFLALRAGELAQIAAARAVHARSEGWRQRFIWPVRARISGRFGAQRVYRGTPAAYHSGTDLAGGAGTVFVAPADGVVVLAADHLFTLEGNLLMVDHGMGLNSAFLHAERLLVKQGDVVTQGQPLGLIGKTGRVTGPHLHWSMKWGDARIDPERLLPPL